jgi:VWFA-related protein
MFRAVVVASVAALAFIHSPAPSSNQQLPTFRTGVDIVEIDVTVLDKDRHPVKGLTADNFTVLDHGQPQPIVAFSAIDVPAPVTYPAPWMRDAPLDVVSNVENRRLVTIVMDDAYTEFNPDTAKRARQIAKNAVDELGPADLAAVIFTYIGRRQNFTSDRTRLLAAIDSYVPKRTAAAAQPAACQLRPCDLEALSTAAAALSTAAPGRKIAMIISEGRRFQFGGPADSENETSKLSKLFRDLQRANVTVYAFDARGLPVSGGFSAENRRPVGGLFGLENDSLYTFAESTGGRVIANTNDPESHVAETFRESNSYYFIGFRASVDSGRKGLRKIEVKVNRPGVQVHTRSGYYPLAKAPEPGEVVNGLPSGDLPVHATAAVVAVPGRREAEVIVATRVDPPRSSSQTRTIELLTAAMDLDAKPRGIQRQTITVTPNPASVVAPDLPAHLPLAPGRYVVQVSARVDGRAGGAAVDIDVPNFANDPLSASGLMLQRRPAPPIADKAIQNLVPFLPTTVRQFHPGDDIGVLVRIYQGGKGRIAPVRMTAKVTNERNVVTNTQEAMLEPENFSMRSADYQVTLPLAHLTPGQYLLEVDAQSGARHVTRTARFSLVK